MFENGNISFFKSNDSVLFGHIKNLDLNTVLIDYDFNDFINSNDEFTIDKFIWQYKDAYSELLNPQFEFELCEELIK